jgi:hypothetical protein
MSFSWIYKLTKNIHGKHCSMNMNTNVLRQRIIDMLDNKNLFVSADYEGFETRVPKSLIEVFKSELIMKFRRSNDVIEADKILRPAV